MNIRLMDVHTFSEFTVPFKARWTTVTGDELRIVMHRSQLEELAEEINTVLADLPADEDEDSRTGNTGAEATVLPAVREESRAAPDPIREILRQIYAWRGAA